MKKDLLALAIVAAIIGLFCQDILLDQKSPSRGDIPLQFYPWKAYTRSMLAAGQIPYWNPYTFGGAPFLANMQSAVFYPLDLILFLFPMEWFFGLSLILHLLLAGAGAYLLARRCGASSFPSVFAGIAYGLNGFTMIHIPAGNHLTYAGAAWVPWMFLAIVGFATSSSRRLPWALAASLITCLHFLCGHPQMTFYSLFFSTLLCFAAVMGMPDRDYRARFFSALLRTAVLSCFLVLGIAMAGMQLVPTLEYLEQANRAASLDIDMATEFSFAPHRLITLFFPEYYGTHIAANHYDYFYFWSCAYAGIVTPILAAAVFFLEKKSAAAVPLAAIGLLGLFLACGRGNPIYTMLMHLPGFGQFRAPAKFLPYYLVPVCVLAALGLERAGAIAYERRKQGADQAELIKRCLPMFLLLALIFVYGTPRIANLTHALRLVRDEGQVNAIRTLAFTNGSLIALASLALFLFARKIPRYPRLAISLSLTLLLCLDLFTYGKGYLDASLQRLKVIQMQTALPQELGPLTLAIPSRFPDRAAALMELDYPNLFVLWRTLNIAGYDPMSLKSYNRLIGKMEGWQEGIFHDNIQLTQFDHHVLDLLNVRYVLTLRTIEDSNLKLANAGGEFRVYERLNPNRCWASSAQKKSETLTGDETWQPADAEIEAMRYEPNRIAFQYAASEPQWLRLAEWDYPGWKAEATLE
ncbi:MAG: hypothetical protein AB1656_07865, partial [Candidatus Omnitrophota bacterium]